MIAQKKWFDVLISANKQKWQITVQQLLSLRQRQICVIRKYSSIRDTSKLSYRQSQKNYGDKSLYQ